MIFLAKNSQLVPGRCLEIHHILTAVAFWKIPFFPLQADQCCSEPDFNPHLYPQIGFKCIKSALKSH